jgi:hypothetical protein
MYSSQVQIHILSSLAHREILQPAMCYLCNPWQFEYHVESELWSTTTAKA